jgi:hypothetical protein
MPQLKFIVLFTISIASLVAGSAIAYYYGYALPKKDKEVLALLTAKLSITPTPTLTPTPTASPTATPTIVYRYIPRLPTPTQTPTTNPTPSAAQQTTQTNTNAPHVPINPTLGGVPGI